MKISAFFAALSLIAFSASCDKHSWEETQVLHEGMHEAHHGDEAHDDGHAKPDAHGDKDKEHGAKDDHAGEKKSDH